LLTGNRVSPNLPCLSLRLALLYAGFFAIPGVLMPFWPLWLGGRGFDAEEIGTLIAIGTAAKVIAGPVVAAAADRLGERRRPIIGIALFSLLAFSLFQPAHGFWAILSVSVAFFAAWPQFIPLTESLTMVAVRAYNLDYGRIRLWGSLSFIVAAVGGGHLLTSRPAEILYGLVLVLIGLTVAISLFAPDLRTERSQPGKGGTIFLLRQRPFAVLLLAAGLIQGSHAVYYAFGTLHWQSLGYSEGLIGALWAEGVIAEIILFAVGRRLLNRWGAVGLIVMGGIAALLRWSLTAVAITLPLLVIVQALHAFTFGATHLGTVHALTRLAPPSLSGTAQSLYTVVVAGVFLSAMTWAAGSLYQAFSGGGYFPMAAAGAAGALAAWTLRDPPTRPSA
jgi:PPP family 3-phenylpropionic acid transporter